MKKSSLKKLLFLFQAICMIVAVTVWADCTALAAASVANAEEFYSAVKNAGTSAVEILLTDNITIDSALSTPAIAVGSEQDITIDLNGKTMYFADATILSVNSGKLTLKNGSIEANAGNVAVSAEDGAALHLENITGTASSGALIYSDASAIYLNGATLSALDGTTPVIELNGTDNKVYGSDGAEIQTIGSSITQSYNSANSSNGSSSQGTLVTVEVEDAYSVIIPESIDFGKLTYTDDESVKLAVKTGTIKAEYIISDGTQKLNVSVYGDGENGEFILKNGSDVLEYVFKDASGNVIQPNGIAASFAEAGSLDISLVIDRSALTKSGKYSGYLNFKFSLE